LLFELSLLDTLIDIEDSVRRILSATYELLILSKTNKLKYLIGCIHRLDLIETTFAIEETPHCKSQGGQNSNTALDEYISSLCQLKCPVKRVQTTTGYNSTYHLGPLLTI
jgi:hypothetical protein